MTPRVRARGLAVRFHFDRDHRVVTPTMARLRRHGKSQWGLREVDVEIAPGRGVALLGRSGSGKTTFLRAIAGVYRPDQGVLDVRGRVASLLSIEAGLISVLTGRENALLLAVLAGGTRREARRSAERIKELSGLGDHFEDPVSSFSQGMRARLGFSVGRVSEPDILLLDEVHEALDHEFRDVVASYAAELLARGGAIVAAGHDHPLLARFCGDALYLEEGRVAATGQFDAVRARYLGRLTQDAAAPA